MKKLWIVLLMLGFGSPAAAQGDGIDQDRAAKEVAGKMLLAADKQKLVAEMRYKVAVEARTTTGAPYSAEAVTESTQVLADGNRINQKSVTRVYRDGEGRTRREDLDDAGTVVSVSIVDPVAHANYVLQPASRTAHRESVWVEMPKIEGASWGRGMIVYPDGDRPDSQARERQKVEEAARVKAARPVPPPPPPAPLPGLRAALEKVAAGAVKREDLGRQNIEGVAATGTRSTTTIAAGAIGNLQPIKVVAEQWFSPDLQVLVLTKHSDPRTGETTYRLQSIVRAEPDRSLFSVPPDYTLKESRIREPF